MKIILILMVVLLLSFTSVAAGQDEIVARPPSNLEQFKECVAVTAWLLKGRNLDKLEESKKITIPPGWKVVGTGMASSKPVFFLCR
jgi:hypothetical protein